jgi:hypothetical protein
MKCQETEKVPINCPQLPAQKALVTSICLHTNKPFQGVVWRSHSDPETRVDELHRPKQGVGAGVALTATTGVPALGIMPEMPEVVEPAVQRAKLSLAHEIVLERDVKRPPPSVHGRDALPDPNLPELFAKYTQEQDVVRLPPVYNHGNDHAEPAIRPLFPLLRTKNKAL